MTRTARATVILVTVNMTVYILMLSGWSLRGCFPDLPSRMTAILTLPSTLAGAIDSPWTIITYMFTHVSFVHLTVNMLWLIGFGPAIKGGVAHTLGIYLAGGIGGAAAFICCPAAEWNHAGELAGASASVVSVVVASACLSPNRRLRMLLIGDVRLIWVALVAILTMFAGSPVFSPATAAHVGGAVTGGIAGLALRIHNQAMVQKAMTQARLHTRRLSLIHKAGQSGFASLSEDERLELFDLQNRRYN